MIGMGSGKGCDAQYLFAEDILGYNNDHIPRHAKVYSDVSKDYERIMTKALKAFKKFKSEVVSKKYPEEKHDISISEEEYSQFLKKLNNK